MSRPAEFVVNDSGAGPKDLPSVDALLRFVEEMSFDHVGAFPFSAEPGTVAAALPDHVPPALQEERYAALMELQQGISLRRHQALVGQTLPGYEQPRDWLKKHGSMLPPIA